MSPAKVQLGQLLFFDTRLSVTLRYACASCHRPELAFTDGRGHAIGATGSVLDRGAMSLANIAYARGFGWRPNRFTSIEAQMRQPLFNEHPIEMGLHVHQASLLESLRNDPQFVRQFAQAFPGPGAKLSVFHIIQAIACYERTLISGNSAFDHYVFGDDRSALSDAAKRGMALFYSSRVGCSQCHFGVAFAGPPAVAGRPLPRALYAHTGTGGLFKVPSLRNIALTAPYMHDGRFVDLPAVISHYEQLGKERARGRQLDRRLQRFELRAAEKLDLIDFLNALTDLQFSAHAPP